MNPPLVEDWETQDCLAAVAAQGDAAIERAFALTEKGASYSARNELRRALRAVAQAIDAYAGTTRHSQHLVQGLQALAEAEDFQKGASSAERGVHVPSLVATHRTPALKDRDVSRMPALVAMQRYYTFAQEQLELAAGGAPVASRLLYALGKVQVALSEQDAAAATAFGPKAMAYYQAALMVNPANHQAANELGVLLARFGQLQDARTVLQHSVALHGEAETWHNLVVVHQRLGEWDLAERARFELTRVQRQRPPTAGPARGSRVQWVDPQTFGSIGYTGVPTEAPRPAAQPHTAEKPSGFWTW
jgi:tetratricopeptide (TPR) repeat protein